jgi:hypothetical protein
VLWSAEVLRGMLWHALGEAKLASTDLIRGYTAPTHSHRARTPTPFTALFSLTFTALTLCAAPESCPEYGRYDRDVDTEKLALDRSEFVRMFERLFRRVPSGLWRDEIEPIVQGMFEGIAGKHDNVGNVLSIKVGVTHVTGAIAQRRTHSSVPEHRRLDSSCCWTWLRNVT